MDADELRSVIENFGTMTRHNQTLNVTLTVLFGMFVVLFTLSTRILLQKGLGNRATCAMFITTLAGFLLTTVAWTSGVAAAALIDKVYFTNNVNPTLKLKVEQSVTAAYIPNVIHEWSTYLLPIISDAVVIWRTWVFFQERRWIMMGPLVLLLGSLATTFIALRLFSRSPLSYDQKLFNNIIGASAILSVATNASSTLLIFLKLWTYRKFWFKDLNLLRPSLVQNILAILVESGSLYLVVQIVFLVLTFLPGPTVSGTAPDIVATIFITLYLAISGMYPAIIVILVHHKSSVEETYGISALIATGAISNRDVEVHPATAGHLSFAAPPSTIRSTDTEVLGGQEDDVGQGDAIEDDRIFNTTHGGVGAEAAGRSNGNVE